MVWLLFGLLFLVPFVDLRRPFRLLHLDLVVLLLVGFGPLLESTGHGRIWGSLPLTVVGLTYLAARLLHAGFRPGDHQERLVPILPSRWLLAFLVVLLGLRFGYLLGFDQPGVGDVGLASVAGADRITRGEELYDPGLDQTLPPHTDTYGPALYASYVPFELALPWGGGYGTFDYDEPEAGRAAAVVFDLLVLFGLLLLGRQLRPGSEGRLLGLALACAWAAYPYTLFQIRHGFNDGLVALLVLGAFLALPYAAGRGVLTGVATATKFAPALLAPLLATGTGERRLRSSVLFGTAFLGAVLVFVLPFLSPGGLEELWDRTLGYQDGRSASNSIWGEIPDLDRLRTVAQVAVAGLAVALAFVPRRRSPVQLVALGAGVLAALQLTMIYWFHAYLIWLAPLAFAALFAAYDCRRK
jgi:hypothetical protein